jgi:hypothetical protein
MNDNVVNSNLFDFIENKFIAAESQLGENFEFLTKPDGQSFFLMQTPYSEEPLHFSYIGTMTEKGLLFRCNDPGFKHLQAIILND